MLPALFMVCHILLGLRNAIMLSLSSLSLIALLASVCLDSFAIFVSVRVPYFCSRKSLFLNLEEHINLPDK